jgi:hypothetical protein
MRLWPSRKPRTPSFPPLSQEQIDGGIRQKIAELELLDFNALCDLPKTAGVEVTVGPRPAEVRTYVDRLSVDEVRVVVQLSAPDAPGSSWSQVRAQGFRRPRDGSTSAVVPPEIYEWD